MPHPSRRTFLAVSVGALGAASLGRIASARSPGLDDPTRRRFLDAVRAGERQAVEGMLDQDRSLLNARDDHGRSAFALAYLHGHPAVGQLLRDRGHVPDLHESALALDWPRFKALAETRVDEVNAAHPIGGSAMVAAALGGAADQIWRVYAETGAPNARPMGAARPSALRASFEVADLRQAEMTAANLLANGADPNAAEPRGSSPLHAAAARGSAELVEMLVRKGARIDARDDDARTPRQRAEEAGHDAVAALLRDHGSIERDRQTSRRVYDAQGAPYEAPDIEDIDLRRRLRLVGIAHFDGEAVRREVADEPRLVHAVATTTEGAVEACAHTARMATVDFLLERGAPCSIVTAAARGDRARVRALLDEDPLRIHERGPHDFPLLWYAIIGPGSIDLLEMLTAAGAAIERQHFLGTTALHYAAMAGTADEVEWLIAHGADVNRVGRKFGPGGQSPLDLARKSKRPEIERLLVARGARG